MQAYRGFPMFLFVNVRSKNSVNLLCKISKNTNTLPVGLCYPDVNGGGKKGKRVRRNAHCGKTGYRRELNFKNGVQNFA